MRIGFLAEIATWQHWCPLGAPRQFSGHSAFYDQ